MPIQLRDINGNSIALGRELARGGEGAVFDVAGNPNFVAKLYHSASDRFRTEKLGAMVRGCTKDLLQIAAWPATTLHDARSNELLGFLMPRVTGHCEIHQLYSPAQRRQHFPKATWSFLAHVAMNVAAAFETVHKAGHVIGDVNQSGVLVAPNGTVRLIDCDSFQVRSPDGRLFHCVVGVPQYTPPELQGQSFRGTERSVNHDVFGLAVVVFQLLFMGRHPFAGRFSGSGDMPIEKAISGNRFAFGANAASRQMTPPPMSLSFDVLPKTIAELFERAFAAPGTRGPRPLASEWREGIAGLKTSLKKCSSDPGHMYPDNASGCPWCQLMRAGAPNFFLTVHFVGSATSTFELPVIDFDALYRRVEGLLQTIPPRPILQAPRVPPQPAPMPEWVQDQLFILKLLRVCGVGSAVVAILGIFKGGLLLYEGAGLTIVFAVWILFMTLCGKASQELNRRRAKAAELRRRLADLDSRWLRKTSEVKQSLQTRLSYAASARDRGRNASSRYRAERHQLESHRQQDALEEYLDHKFIRDYRIPKIGPGRLLTLISYGIETAADVSEERLNVIPGFGPGIISELLAWRAGLARQFVYDPLKADQSKAIRALFAQYRQIQQAAEAEIHAMYGEASTAIQSATAAFNGLRAEMDEVVRLHAQAAADATV